VGDGLEEFGRQVTFEGDALNEARPVAHEQEGQLALVCAIVDPALEDDVLSDVVRDLCNADMVSHWKVL